MSTSNAHNQYKNPLFSVMKLSYAAVPESKGLCYTARIEGRKETVVGRTRSSPHAGRVGGTEHGLGSARTKLRCVSPRPRFLLLLPGCFAPDWEENRREQRLATRARPETVGVRARARPMEDGSAGRVRWPCPCWLMRVCLSRPRHGESFAVILRTIPGLSTLENLERVWVFWVIFTMENLLLPPTHITLRWYRCIYH
jgi:hypothetical protein